MILSLSVGYGVGQKGFQANIAKGGRVTISRVTPEPDVDFSLFWKVWDLINSSYFDKAKIMPSKMVYGAIKGMVASLGDPYTMFLPPQENQLSNDDLQGNFSGVGIELGYKNGQLAVIAPLPETPAAKAGVKPGDLIVAIKDEAKNIDITTENLNINEAIQNIRGPIGTKIILTLVREGEEKPIVLELIRQTIDVPSVALDYVGDNKDVAHLSLYKFGGDTLTEWQTKVNEIKAKPETKGVVLDLRNNPGGYLEDAIKIAGEFIPKGSVAVIQQNADGSKLELKTDNEGAFLNTKVVVLINGGSASASEILAGALRDDRQIKLIGEKSFGKGTVQSPEDLDNGAGIHITIAKWLTPNGTWVHGNGLDPDTKITPDSSNAQNDTQLKEAIKQIFS